MCAAVSTIIHVYNDKYFNLSTPKISIKGILINEKSKFYQY